MSRVGPTGRVNGIGLASHVTNIASYRVVFRERCSDRECEREIGYSLVSNRMSSLFFAQVGARPDLDLRTAHTSTRRLAPRRSRGLAAPSGVCQCASRLVSCGHCASHAHGVSNSVTLCKCICGRSESGGGRLAPLAAHIECAMPQHRTTCCCRRFILLRSSGQLLSSAAHSMMARLCLRFVMRGPMSRMSESAV